MACVGRVRAQRARGGGGVGWRAGGARRLDARAAGRRVRTAQAARKPNASAPPCCWQRLAAGCGPPRGAECRQAACLGTPPREGGKKEGQGAARRAISAGAADVR